MVTKSLREQAMDYLSRREYSQWELSQKLLRKGYEVNEILEIIDKLIFENLQSDTRFTESYIRSRVANGYGPIRIRMELQQRGVAADIIDQHLSMNSQFWREVMENVWQKKFKGVAAVDQKAKAKQSRFLMQRGFWPESIFELLSDVSQ